MASNSAILKPRNEGIAASLSPFSGQALLVAAVLAALGLLILPVPAPVLDALLALNFILTLTVLATGLSQTDPVRFSSFPGLLLLLTLFRLGLSLNSARLILTKEHAGELIGTMGRLAAGGNAAVGCVVFLVMQVVHFLVVGKGSERVAEVAARFTLDALPGKQMSIDADLRAGLIDEAAAGRKRAEVLRESRFYGAMDGAMKFVKGECAAVFLIACVNAMGGMCVGVLQRGLSFAQAASRYALLAIGDALAAELPAFAVAITAGLLVTRVPSGKRGSWGHDIAAQVFGGTKPLAGAALALSVCAFLPGMPSAAFAVPAVAFASLAILRAKKSTAGNAENDPIRKYEFLSDTLPPGQTIPFLLEVGPELRAEFTASPHWIECFDFLYPRLRMLLSNRTGVPFPELKLGMDEAMPKRRYVVKIHGIPVTDGLIGESNDAAGTLLRHVGRVLRRHAREFVGIQETRDTLSSLEECAPELVREVVPRLMSAAKLADVVKRLVDEGVPVNDFRLILETLAACGAEAKDAVVLTECVRAGMKRVISHRHSGGSGRLTAFCVEPGIEAEIAKGIVRDGTECYLALPPETASRLVAAFAAAYSTLLTGEMRPVILTHSGIRRYVRKLIENDLPDVAVLSYQELEPNLIVTTQNTIALEAP